VTETQGIVLAEAFAAGLPVVAIDSPQTRESFGTHLAGSIVANAEAMSEALHALLTDEAKRNAASAHARAAAAPFDIRVTAERVLAVYRAALGSRSGKTDLGDAQRLFEVVSA